MKSHLALFRSDGDDGDGDIGQNPGKFALFVLRRCPSSCSWAFGEENKSAPAYDSVHRIHRLAIDRDWLFVADPAPAK